MNQLKSITTLTLIFYLSFAKSQDTIPQFLTLEQQSVECAPSDFFWIYKGDTLQNNDTYFLCPDDTVNYYDITLVPVVFNPLDSIIYLQPIEWRNPSYQYKHPHNKKDMDLKALVYRDGIKSGEYTMTVSNEKLTVTYKDHDMLYAYDDNRIREYWPSWTPKPNTPWKYIPVGETVSGTITINEAKSTSWKGKIIETTAPAKTAIHPMRFYSGSQNVNLSALNDVSDISSIVKAGCMDTLLNIMSGKKRTDTIDFYLLSYETDDILNKTGPVNSSTEVCILPGLNKKIDDPRFYSSQGDSIIRLANGVPVAVVAGNDLICNSKLKFLQPQVSKAINYQVIINQVNEIYNKVGFTFIIGYIDTLKYHFEIFKNEQLDDNEYNEINENYFKRNNIAPKRTKVLIWSDLVNRQGYASLRSNVIAFKNTSNGNTLAHEIGHAKFGFRHPDNDDKHLNSIEDFLPQQGISVKAPYKVNDLDSLMHSVSVGDKLRAYHWKKIILND
jgi:hypothetical protein